MSVMPDCLRSAVVSSPTGDFTFTPSPDPVLYYEARAYAQGTSSPIVATKYLGAPSADPISGFIKVNLATMLNALPPGNYDVTTLAVGIGGSSESGISNVFTVPLA